LLTHIDRASLAGLCGPEIAIMKSAFNQELAAGEIRIGPFERHGFARPGTGTGEQGEQGSFRQVAGTIEEGRDFGIG